MLNQHFLSLLVYIESIHLEKHSLGQLLLSRSQWKKEQPHFSRSVKSCRCTPSTPFIYCGVLLCGEKKKLLASYAAWYQIAVAHGMMEKDRLLTDVFIKTAWVCLAVLWTHFYSIIVLLKAFKAFKTSEFYHSYVGSPQLLLLVHMDLCQKSYGWCPFIHLCIQTCMCLCFLSSWSNKQICGFHKPKHIN